jgi:hypothetical protein
VRIAGAAIALLLLLIFWPAAALATSSGGISGRVIEGESQKPIEGVEVCAFAQPTAGQEEEAEIEPDSCVQSGSGGEYTISGLSPLSYTVGFGDPFPGTLNYVTRYYNEKPNPGEATPVTVSATTVANIDATLEVGAEITGTTTSAATGAPVEGVTVCATKAGSAALEFVSCALSVSGGSYTITGLPEGSFDVIFDGAGYTAQAYAGVTSLSEATVLSIKAKEVRAGVDASLQTLMVQPITGLPLLAGISPPATPTLKGPISRRPAVALASTRIEVARNGTALVKLRCSPPLACDGRLAVTEKRTVTRAHKRLSVTIAIATGVFALKSAQSATVKVDVGSTGRRLLRADHSRLGAHLVIAQTVPLPALTAIEHVVLVERARAATKP